MADISNAVAYAFAKDYSGSGDWLNSGTGGSSHDMTINGATHTSDAGGDYFDFDGTNDYMSTADHADLDFGAAASFTFGVAFFGDVITTGYLLQKRVAADAGYAVAFQAGGNNHFGVVEDASANAASDNGPAITVSTKHTLIVVVNETDGDIEVFTDGAGTGGGVSTASVGDRSNANALELGRRSDGTYFNGRIFSYAVIPLALTDAEVGTGTNTLHDNLINQTVPGVKGYWGMRAE